MQSTSVDKSIKEIQDLISQKLEKEVMETLNN